MNILKGIMSRDKSKAEWPPSDNALPLATFAGGCFWGKY